MASLINCLVDTTWIRNDEILLSHIHYYHCNVRAHPYQSVLSIYTNHNSNHLKRFTQYILFLTNPTPNQFEWSYLSMICTHQQFIA